LKKVLKEDKRMQKPVSASCGRWVCGVLLSAAASSCASVTAVPVDPLTWKAKMDAPEGIPYYLPRPYLLVTEVPVETPPPKAQQEEGKGGAAAKAAPGKGTSADKSAPPADDAMKKATPAPDDGSGTSPSPASDQSFGMFTKQYGVKLIYLPDYEHPMLLRQRAGIGSTTLKPTLQNGWMLTALDSSADSKTAETLASIGSLVSATHGGGSGGTGGSKSGGGEEAKGAPPPAKALPPGLYRLVVSPKGVVVDICQVARFESTGVLAALDLQACAAKDKKAKTE
jgi:hypothetical protein